MPETLRCWEYPVDVFFKALWRKVKSSGFDESEFSALRFVLHVVKEKLTFVYASVDQLELYIKKSSFNYSK